jgi:hypothetical protein
MKRNTINLCQPCTTVESTVEPRFTNASHHEQIRSRINFPNKKCLGWWTVSRVITRKPATTVGDKLGVSAGERQLLCNFHSVHIPARICRAFTWISLCFVDFFNTLLNKTPWDQRSLTLSQLMLYIRSVSKTFGEWYQKTNKTEDTNKLTLLAFKIIAILYNTWLATFIKLLETVSKGLVRNRSQNSCQTSVGLGTYYLQLQGLYFPFLKWNIS